MIEIIKSCAQGSDEWFNRRLASIGGTAIGKIAPQGKGRKDILFAMVGELITGIPSETFKFKHADRGTEFEPEARQYYELTNSIDVEQVALVRSGEYKHYSPDGLIGVDGMLEIKVRIPSVFVNAVTDGHFPIDVKRQIQWGLSITERQWCDYVQYCPEIANAGYSPSVCQRVYRDEKTILELDERADEFISEMIAMANKIKTR